MADGSNQRDTTTGDDAFFDRGTRGVQCVLDAGLLLFHLYLSRRTDFDHGNTAGQLSHALLELLAVIVRGGVFDLHTNLADATLDCLSVTGAIYDGGVILIHGDALGITQVLQRCTLEIQTHFLRDHRAACEDRDVLQHSLATIAEARRFTRCDFHDAAHVVHDQCRKRFTFHVLSNNDQWA